MFEIPFSKMKYESILVTFTEIPDEISLCFNITGCPCQCRECFEPWLAEDTGMELNYAVLEAEIASHPHITCVCFMGGDQNLNELYDLCKRVKKRGYKVCIYSGSRSTKVFSVFYDTACLDYIKIGNYIESCGGLNSSNTNQRMFLFLYLSLNPDPTWVLL